MNFLELANKRYSVRGYKDVEVEKDKLLNILEAGRIAPSAVNFQPWHFIVITNQELRSKINETYTREWFYGAPTVIVVCGDHSTSWKRKDGKDHSDIDAAIAIDHMTLAAADLGLGTCWICAFDAAKCHELLELPPHLEVVALLPVGYPNDDNIPEKKRKSLEEIVSWNGYQ